MVLGFKPQPRNFFYSFFDVKKLICSEKVLLSAGAKSAGAKKILLASLASNTSAPTFAKTAAK